MITNKDSLGNELTQEQIEYFKNTKIVDKDNNLLVVYHGSPTPYFKEFNPRDNKSQFGKYKFGDKNVNYFTTDRKSASTYTEFGYDDGTLFEVYLNIENPYIVDNKSEAEIKSHLNIKDDRLRKHQIELFDRIFNKWKGKILDYSDYRFDELNDDLHKLNLELRPSDEYEPDTDPMDIEYFDLWNLGRNSFIGAEHIIEYQYATDEIFDDSMYDQLKEEIIGEDPNDYYFSTDDIVRFVLSLDEGYDGIIIKDIHDSKDMFSDITTDIITLGSPNQIKSISNKNPSSSGKIDEKIDDIEDFDPDELAQLIGMEEVEEPKEEEPQETDKNSDWYKSMLDTIEQSRKYRKGWTFKLDQKDKEYLQKNYPSYSFKVVDLKDVIKRNNLNNPDHGMFGRHTDIWGTEPGLYWYSKNKNNERLNPIRLTQDLRVIDGNHRLYALYNMGYSKAEVLVYNDTKLTEALLLEVSRRQIIDKSKKGRAYSQNNQALGKNRWERKKWSRVANSTREFNSIDMNTFFKKDILIVNVPVQGETDNYIVKIKFSGVLEEIRKNVQANNNKLDYRIISQALSRVFNNGDVYIHCNCPDATFRFNYWQTVQGYNSGKPENRPNRFDWTNKYDDMGGACKHGNLVLSNLSWMMKVASVINNYIHYAEMYMQRLFADIIFPKIYGIKYPDAVQLGMFDRMYLKHSKGVIDAINQYGATRTRFKKTKPDNVEIKQDPKQLSIFDIEDEEEEIPTDKFGNKGFKKQSIFDLGVEDVEEVEEKPKGFKPKRDVPVVKPKGFKKISIFDDEESED